MSLLCTSTASLSLCLLVLPSLPQCALISTTALPNYGSPLELYPSFIAVESGLLEQTKWLCKYEFQILLALMYGGSFFEPLICL